MYLMYAVGRVGRLKFICHRTYAYVLYILHMRFDYDDVYQRYVYMNDWKFSIILFQDVVFLVKMRNTSCFRVYDACVYS
jgi:hypothetical protein